MDKALQESVEEGEKKRVMQSPNRSTIWSRSQQPREKAMVGPRFEQTIMEDQVCYSFCFFLFTGAVGLFPWSLFVGLAIET